MKTSTGLVALALAGVVALAGCSKSSTSPSSTPTPTQTAAQSSQVSTQPTAPASSAPSTRSSSATNAPGSVAALARYNAWSKRYFVLANRFSDAAAAGNLTAAANDLDLMGAHARQGKNLPSIGNAKADQEWQNAMDDLNSAATIGASAIRARDTDRLLDAMDLITRPATTSPRGRISSADADDGLVGIAAERVTPRAWRSPAAGRQLSPPSHHLSRAR